MFNSFLFLFKKTISKYNLQILYYSFLFFIFIVIISLFFEKLNPILTNFFANNYLSPVLTFIVALILFISYILVLAIYLAFILTLFDLSLFPQKDLLATINRSFQKVPSFFLLILLFLIISLAALIIAIFIGTGIATLLSFWLPKVSFIVGGVVIFLISQYTLLWVIFSPFAFLQENNKSIFRALSSNFVLLKGKSFSVFLKILVIDLIFFLIFVALLYLLKIPLLLKVEDLSLGKNLILNFFFIFLFLPFYVFYLSSLWEELQKDYQNKNIPYEKTRKLVLVFIIISLIIILIGFMFLLFFSRLQF